MEIAIALLQHYSFDLGGYTINDLTRAWGRFKPEWVRQAVIESLFQGRYKAVSVSQILYLWERKGEANYRYNREFERLVCGDVAVIYEDRIFYTPPRTSVREAGITEIAPFVPPEKVSSPIPFPKRSTIAGMKINQESPPKAHKYPSRTTSISGTTEPAQTYPEPIKTQFSEAYLSAYESMTLFAETSIFVDKLRSMCGDRLVLPVPEFEVEKDQAEVMN
ncbi:hypothetical protein H6F42_00685 [Pseudanabaena sp. FACHB-1998]|uniref:hypothetical protein n=1 Tax=Pseudanabaena sp. FACHB-1998 TaxID=2692858 RepID=UPI0016812B46|nr:hypothetical protein [Pseudanabaena sp. FACHB-1998]MBD2175429.1 hypothetical protein [Pseudanabaena sp. FACHB-1998]